MGIFPKEGTCRKLDVATSLGKNSNPVLTTIGTGGAVSVPQKHTYARILFRKT